LPPSKPDFYKERGNDWAKKVGNSGVQLQSVFLRVTYDPGVDDVVEMHGEVSEGKIKNSGEGKMENAEKVVQEKHDDEQVEAQGELVKYDENAVMAKLRGLIEENNKTLRAEIDESRKANVKAMQSMLTSSFEQLQEKIAAIVQSSEDTKAELQGIQKQMKKTEEKTKKAIKKGMKKSERMLAALLAKQSIALTDEDDSESSAESDCGVKSGAAGGGGKKDVRIEEPGGKGRVQNTDPVGVKKARADDDGVVNLGKASLGISAGGESAAAMQANSTSGSQQTVNAGGGGEGNGAAPGGGADSAEGKVKIAVARIEDEGSTLKHSSIPAGSGDGNATGGGASAEKNDSLGGDAGDGKAQGGGFDGGCCSNEQGEAGGDGDEAVAPASGEPEAKKKFQSSPEPTAGGAVLQAGHEIPNGQVVGSSIQQLDDGACARISELASKHGASEFQPANGTHFLEDKEWVDLIDRLEPGHEVLPGIILGPMHVLSRVPGETLQLPLRRLMTHRLSVFGAEAAAELKREWEETGLGGSEKKLVFDSIADREWESIHPVFETAIPFIHDFYVEKVKGGKTAVTQYEYQALCAEHEAALRRASGELEFRKGRGGGGPADAVDEHHVMMFIHCVSGCSRSPTYGNWFWFASIVN